MEAEPNPDDYFREIESHFAGHRKTPFVLSAKDWALMKGWREAGIPLAVVLEAIDQVFEKNESSGRRKVISSLSYCRHAIKELWDERRELLVGDGEALPEGDLMPMLDRLVADLQATNAPVDAIIRATSSIREALSLKSVPKIEERLIEIERTLLDEILSSASPEVAMDIRSAVETSLAGAKVDAKVRQRTEEANLRRLIRDRFALPRLTLFR